MKKTQTKHSKFFKSLFHPREIFSIRKFSFGVTSVLLGSFFIGGQPVHAEEISQKAETPQTVVEESIHAEAPTEVAVDDTSTKVAEVVPESEVATIELIEASEISESPVDSNQESGVKENVVIESSVVDVTEQGDGESTVLNKVEKSDEKLSELPINIPNESIETRVDTASYSDRSASEEDPKVEEENQKRLKYFAELNSSGFSRIEIPEGMTTIDANAFSGNQNLKEIILPTTLTTIGYGAFENSGLEKIILPTSLTYIGERAFAGISTLKEVVIPKNLTYAPNIFTGSNNLKKVTFEDGITVIPASILAGTSVEEIQLPSSVETIDSYAFSENKYLKKINLKDGVKAIHSGAFAGNTSLAQVELPEGLEYIADSAFNGTTSLTSIVIPTSVKGISYSAFFDSGLTSIQLPENLETIDNYAFSSTRLSEVKLPASLKYLGWGAFANIESLKRVEINSDIETGHYSNSWHSPFASSPLTGVRIKDGVTIIADRMFEGQPDISSLSLPSSLLEIKPYAFEGIGVESLVLPAGLQKLGTHSFASSSNLKSVIIPSSLVEGDGAFIDSKDLVNISFASGTTKIIDGLFRGTGFSEFTIPEGITEIGANAFSENENLTTITLPSTLRTIGANAFANTSLKRIVLPPGMKKIPDGLLQGTKVEEFVIPEGVEEIGVQAFAYNTFLKSVVLPSSLKKIGYGAFQNTGIESIIFKDGLVEIDDYAFSNTNLKSVLLPNSVTRLGGSAFSGISTLTSVTLSEGLTEINAGTFSGTSLERVTLPSAVTTIHDSAFSRVSALKDIIFSDGLKRIERSAFDGTGLTDVTLPSQLEYLGAGAFATESLRSIHIPQSLKEVESIYWLPGPFTGATNLQTVTFETGIRQIVANLFRGSHIESMDLPATVEEIGSSAFAESGLKEIGLQNGLKKIGASAFYRTSLESIHIPDSVTEIGTLTFAESLKLKQAKLSASITYVPASMFSNTILSRIDIPTGVERIEDGAFYSTNLSRVILPETLKEIGASAFADTPLTSISFPANLEKIGNGAFWKTSLEEVTIPKTIKELGGAVFSEIATLKEAHVAKDFVGGDATFRGSSILEKVTFEEGRTEIPSEFFANTGVKEVILPKELKVIGSGAFRSTHNLKVIDLGEKLEELGSEAFRNSGLTRITLPDSLTSFGYAAFADSSSLQSVRLPETLTNIPEEAFQNTGLLSLNLPSSVTRIERAAFANAKISTIDFSTGLETIGGGAFSGNRFEKLELPKSLKELGYSAFSDNNNLTFLYINSDLEHDRYGSYYYNSSPFKHSNYSSDTKSLYVEFKDGVTKIPARLFAEAKQVIRVDLPEGLKEIGESAFYGTSIMKDESKESAPKPPANENSNAEKEQQNAPFDAVSMTRLELPDSLETIGNHAFGGIDTLTSVNIPKNLVVADQAFAGSRNLTHLRNNVEGIRIPDGMLEETGVATFIVPEGVTEIGKYALRNNKTTDNSSPFGSSSSGPVKWAGLTNVILPSTLTKIDSRTFESTSITFIDVPNGVSEIGDGAFRFNTELETVKLPKELKKLGGYLFEGNEKMTLLVLPDKVESIDVNAFVNMPNLEKVYIPASVNTIGENLIFNPNTTFYVAAGSYAEKYMKERNIPYEIAGDDYKHYNDGIVQNARFSVASQSLKQSGRLALDLNYSFDTAGRNITDKEIRVTLPKGAVTFGKQISIDGKVRDATVENDVLIIKNIADTGRIRFVVTTNASELIQLQLAAQVLYKEYGIQKSEVLGHLNEEMPFLMIKADTAISGNRVRIVGRTKPNTTVEFKIFEPIIGGTMHYVHATQNTWEEGLALAQNIVSDMTGQFEAVLNLDFEKLFDVSAKQGDSFKIRAIATVEGMQVKADSEKIIFEESLPTLSSFIMKYGGKEYDLADGEADNGQLIFKPGQEFEFVVRLENDIDVAYLEVLTSRNGVVKKVHLSKQETDDLDDTSHTYTFKGLFDPTNPDFVPGDFVLRVVPKGSEPEDNVKNRVAMEELLEQLQIITGRWSAQEGFSKVGTGSIYEAFLNFISESQSENIIGIMLEIGKKTFDFTQQGLGAFTLPIGIFDEMLQIKKDMADFVLRMGMSTGDIKYFALYKDIVGKFPEIVSKDKIGKVEDIIVGLKAGKNFETLAGISNYLDSKSHIFKGLEAISVGVTVIEFILREMMYQEIVKSSKNIPVVKDSTVLDSMEINVDGVNALSPLDNNIEIYYTTAAVSVIYDLISLGTSITGLNIVNLISGIAKLGTDLAISAADFLTGAKKPTPKFDEMKVEAYKNMMENYFLDVRALYMNKFGYYGYKQQWNQSGLKAFNLNLESYTPIIDPSGRVLNSVTGKPVVNATAKVYYKDEDGNEVLWNAGDYSQLNPVLTTIHGEYAWDVPEGLWKVKIEKDGYEVAESDWLPVPPPHTEVNFNLQPKTYSLTFVLDGGKATSILPTSYMTEVEFALPLAEKEGYDFFGWFDNEDRTGTPVTTSLFSTVGDKKLWAGWDIPLVTEVPNTAPTSPELPSVKIETTVRRQETVLTTDVVDYYDDPTLADHLTREELATPGLLVTELTDYYVDGVLVRTDTKEISRTDATPKKVYRGTKHVTAVPDTAPTSPELPTVKIETKVRRVETVLITDVVDYYDDPTLADHITREESGTTGLLVTELTDHYVDGVLVRTDTKEISRTEATPKKVYRGTKHVTAVPDTAPSAPILPTITIRKEERSFTTSEVIHLEDAGLVVGQTREEEGRPGFVIVEIIDYYVDGKVIKTEEVIVSREEATPKILYHGTEPMDPINLPEPIQSDVSSSQVVGIQNTDSKRELPQTGQENSIFSSVLGLCLLSVGTALIKSRKDENTKG
ncbi:leucine-rich repeat protein [Streptococcus suis]|uniref:leucine-rich repeat protein n=1 Tax=Streptococcus suis TaxID=1307 RepID=UPI0037B9A09C